MDLQIMLAPYTIPVNRLDTAAMTIVATLLKAHEKNALETMRRVVYRRCPRPEPRTNLLRGHTRTY